MALKHFGAKHFGARTFTTGFGAGWFQFGAALGALYLKIIRRRNRR
jgi:hypothetical protein